MLQLFTNTSPELLRSQFSCIELERPTRASGTQKRQGYETGTALVPLSAEGSRGWAAPAGQANSTARADCLTQHLFCGLQTQFYVLKWEKKKKVDF